jgi:hypothetical protein
MNGWRSSRFPPEKIEGGEHAEPVYSVQGRTGPDQNLIVFLERPLFLTRLTAESDKSFIAGLISTLLLYTCCTN